MAKRTAGKRGRIEIKVTGIELNKRQKALIDQLFSSQILAVLHHVKDEPDGGSPAPKTEAQVKRGEPKIVSKW